jgi:glycosyltransferase involved in cell wall biosynthesis
MEDRVVSRSAAPGRHRTVSAVIPALNEERNIGWVLSRLPDCVDEVLVVDGRSTDDTIGMALRARPDAQIVRESTPGKGAALRSGFARAQGDLIVMLDADGSMEPAEIVRYAAMLDEGYELVKGSRFLPAGGTTDISRLRSWGNLALLALANGLYSCAFTELCYGFMGLRRSALRRLDLTADGFEIEAEIVTKALRAGLRIAEVPSFEAERRSGASHLRTFRDGSRVLRQLVTVRLRARPSYVEQPEEELAPLAVATAAIAPLVPRR